MPIAGARLWQRGPHPAAHRTPQAQGGAHVSPPPAALEAEVPAASTHTSPFAFHLRSPAKGMPACKRRRCRRSSRRRSSSDYRPACSRSTRSSRRAKPRIASAAVQRPISCAMLAGSRKDLAGLDGGHPARPSRSVLDRNHWRVRLALPEARPAVPAQPRCKRQRIYILLICKYLGGR